MVDSVHDRVVDVLSLDTHIRLLFDQPIFSMYGYFPQMFPGEILGDCWRRIFRFGLHFGGGAA